MAYFALVGPIEAPVLMVRTSSATSALFWDSLTLVLLLASAYRLERDTVGGYSLLFWSAILVAVLLDMAANAWMTNEFNVLPWGPDNDPYGPIDQPRAYTWVQAMFISVGLALYEFAFSIVVLSLQSLGTMFHMKTKRREYAWLIFNFCQVPITIALDCIQLSVSADAQTELWSVIFNFCMQIINLVVFVYWFRQILHERKIESISEKTARIYARVLTRFVEYLFVYIVYMLLYLMASITTILDIVQAGNSAGLCSILISHNGVYACRYFLVFSVVYIFQPGWLRSIESSIVNSILIMPMTSAGGQTFTSNSSTAVFPKYGRRTSAVSAPGGSSDQLGAGPHARATPHTVDVVKDVSAEALPGISKSRLSSSANVADTD